MRTRVVGERAVVFVSVQGESGLPAVDLRRLERLATVRHVATGGDRLTQAEAAEVLAGAQVVALTPKTMPVLDDALLSALPDLQAIALYATGYDMVDVGVLERHGVRLAYLPDYSTGSVAEHALALMLSLSRRVHLGHDRSRGLVPAQTSLRGLELSGRVLGIVGLGRIGSRVAALGQALGMTVLATDVRPVSAPGVQVVDARTLWTSSDVVSLNCSTRLGAPPVVTADEIGLLPADALLVNVSRASLVDHAAVVAAVRSGRLRGYAVDDVVFGPDETDLLTQGRLLQTGHSAWWSDEVLVRGARQWVEAVRRLVVGAPVDLAEAAAPVGGQPLHEAVGA